MAAEKDVRIVKLDEVIGVIDVWRVIYRFLDWRSRVAFRRVCKALRLMTENTVATWKIFSVTAESDAAGSMMRQGMRLTLEQSAEYAEADRVNGITFAIDTSECTKITALIAAKYNLHEKPHDSDVDFNGPPPHYVEASKDVRKFSLHQAALPPATARYTRLYEEKHLEMKVGHAKREFWVTFTYHIRYAKGTWEVFQRLLQLETLYLHIKFPKYVFYHQKQCQMHLTPMPAPTQSLPPPTAPTPLDPAVIAAKADEDAEFALMRKEDSESLKRHAAKHASEHSKHTGCLIS